VTLTSCTNAKFHGSIQFPRYEEVSNFLVTSAAGGSDARLLSFRSPNSTSPTRTTCCGHVSDTPDHLDMSDGLKVANFLQIDLNICYKEKLLPWNLLLQRW